MLRLTTQCFLKMNTNNLAPIILFVYKRPEHTRQVLEALYNNFLANESVLYIYCDAAKENADEQSRRDIEKTRQIVREKQWCKDVIIVESEENKGIAGSIIIHVKEILSKYKKAIVLEDDIITSPDFLSYMNDALEMHKDDEQIKGISGFVPYTSGAEKLPDTFLIRLISSWGWGTWERAWNEYNFDAEYLWQKVRKHKDVDKFNFGNSYDYLKMLEDVKNGILKDVWDIQWTATIFLENGFFLYPKYSQLRNIGFDGTGEHCADDEYLTQNHNDFNLDKKVSVSKIKIQESKKGYEYFKRYYKYGANSTFKVKLIHYICSIPLLKGLYVTYYNKKHKI